MPNLTASLERRLEKFFFQAMRAGGLTRDDKSPEIPGLPGFREFRFSQNGLELVDQWCVNPRTNRSSGNTFIFLKNTLVWQMSFGGFYEKRGIPFLREALHYACERSLFVGGRGPERHRMPGIGFGDVIYTNVTKQGSSFAWFSGREELNTDCRHTTVCLGYYEYRGMMLL